MEAKHVRILIDALGSRRDAGGVSLFAEETINAWISEFPDDEVYVICGPWLNERLLARTGLRVFVWPNSSAPMRILGQLVVTPIVRARLNGPNILALNAVLSPIMDAKGSTLVLYDWRHLRNPREFSRQQRFYRRIWRRSALRAESLACISTKTARETEEVIGRSDQSVVEPGRDHPLRWDLPANAPKVFEELGQYLVTFGHYANKRPELVIGALERLISAGYTNLQLLILGANGMYREQLLQLSRDKHVDHLVTLPGYVPDNEYQWLVVHAAAIVLASSDEGFGLPLAEAQTLGLPAVATIDSGISGLHGPNLVSCEPTVESIAAGISQALEKSNLVQPTVRSWVQAASELRGVALRERPPCASN